jgi:hypothetical protein
MESIPMRPLLIKPGQRFGRLRVIREVKSRRDGNRNRRCFKLKCDCGKTCVVKLIAFTTGQTRSCGCLFIESLSNTRTHGRSKEPIYNIWSSMLSRCENKNNKSYPDYGGRGIKVCHRWHKFENFLVDMGERPSPKYEIDRIDNDGDYKPGNVRWTNSGSSQMHNRRKQKGGTSRFKGVDWWNNTAWRARLTVKGRVYELGLFDSEKAAFRAYNEARSRLIAKPIS